MHIQCLPVMTPEDMNACLDVRRRVFIEEQNVPPEQELDGLDVASRHFAVKEDGRVIATARVRLMGSAAKIERVAVLPQYRSQGVGGILMKYILQEFGKSGDIQLFKLSAQVQALSFYERLGFKKRGGEFMDAGIPHYNMVLEK